MFILPPRWVAVAAAFCLPALCSAAPSLALSSQAQGVDRFTLTVDLPAVEVVETWVEGRLQHEFQLDDAGWIGRPGAPDLPSLQRLIELPDASGARLTLLGGESYEVAGVYPLPCQERLHTEAELPQPWVEDAALYATDAFWPATPWELGEPMLLRNRRVALAAFQPVQVNPVTGVARIWTSMTFELSFAGTSRVNVRTPLPVGGTSLDRTIAAQVFNPLAPAGETRDAAFASGPLPGKYLVFARTAAQSNASLQALLDWKRRKGHAVVVVDEGDVTWTTTGIRDRIVAEYNGAEPVAFVMLVGDTDGSYPLPADGTNYDHWYAMVDGGDILGDVAVGRLSADNTNQLTIICDKILQYETNPYSADESWLESAVLNVGNVACYLSMKILSRSIAGEMVERRGYADIDTTWCANPEANMANWFNQGISFYNYRGWLNMDYMSLSVAQNLLQGPRTPVATIFTCDTGDFNGGDDFTEAYLRAGDPSSPGGAVACLGFATSGTHTRYNNVLCGGYYGGLLEYDLPEAGACLLQGKYELAVTVPPSEYSYVQQFSRWGNLMGDPGMPQWAGVPGALAATLPATLPTGADHLELTFTSGGQPVADVAVCAYQASSGLQVVALTDAAGHVLLPLDGLQAGQLLVTATHHRYRPVLHAATVAQAGVELTLDAWSVGGDDRLTAGAAGQALSVTLRNSGTQNLSNLQVAAELAAGDGSVSGGPLYHASLAPGASHVFSGISLTGAAGIVDGDATPLRIQIATSQGPLTRLADLHAAAPALGILGESYPDGPLNPGATGTLRLTLGNAGSLAGASISATLVSEDADLVTVLSGPQGLGTLNPGASAVADFDVAVAAAVNPGQTLPLRVEWTAGGASGATPAPVVVGTQAIGDPTGPDEHGYWAYEDLDTGYLLAPSFNWYAIAASEGGPGTQVPLSDNGDEQDDAAWVDLPFVFTYYGEPYDRALVCSNGFVAFDENGFGEFDFRNHAFPTSMGPDAMIAPMWDDHESGGGGVWTWYDAAQGAFVVSWVNVPANTSGGPNSFQVVLYDPTLHETATGDGPFLFQYLDFNDTQVGDDDFDKCSIGFKDHTSTVGLTLLNRTIRPATMHALADGRAIYVSTAVGDFIDTFPPVISAAPVGQVEPGEAVQLTATVNDFSGVAWVRLHLKVGAGAWQEIELAPSGNQYPHLVDGQPLGTVVQYWYEAEDLAVPANAGSTPTYQYTVVEGNPPTGPDAYGYVWYDGADAGEAPTFDWIDVSGVGQELALGDDATTTVALPFDFVYFGAAYDQLSVCSNGFVVAGSSSYTTYSNGGLASGDGTPLMLCGFWDDLNPNSGGQVRVWSDTDLHRFVVAWIGVPRYGTSDYQTFEIVIHDPAWWPTVTGDSPVLVQYDVVGSASSCTVGHQNSSRTVGIQYLYDGGYAADAAPVASGQALWLTTGALIPTVDPVTDLQATVVGSQVQLSWTGTGAASYKIYVDDVGYGGFGTLVGSTAGTSYPVPVIGGGRYYQVRASSDAVLTTASPRPVRVLATCESDKGDD